jgi:fructose-1,6-bisphosphatase/inositol monophosphatase family enzyme
MDEEIKILAYETINKIYRKIRKIQLSEYHKFGINVGIGADGTPTKYIDKVAEDVALKFLKKSDVNVNILSEEAGYLDLDGEYTFVIDPIDGTRNAIRGIPIYSISLGVGKKSVNDIGFAIVKSIPTGDVFTAERGNGAFYNNKRIITPELPDRNMVFSINNLKISNNFDLHFFSKLRALGCASIEICLVAIGALDFFLVDEEYLRVTDIAASSLIIKESGGFLSNISGKKIDLDFNLDERTSIIAACNNDLINEIIQRCKDLN